MSNKAERAITDHFSLEPQTYSNFINGSFSEAPVEKIDVFNPSTGQLLGHIPESTSEDVDTAVKAAKAAQSEWEKLPAIVRANYLREISAKVRQHRVELADVIVREQGKVRGLAQVEVDFTADYIDYMAEWARRLEGEG